MTVHVVPRLRFLYVLTLAGYLGTLALIVAWYGWLAPARHLSVVAVLVLLLAPLLAPLHGLLHGRRYTVTWSCFVALFYFVHGVVEAYSAPVTRYLGLLEVMLTSLWFIAALAYIRLSGSSRTRGQSYK
jgi:uncharacterized membrane protein